MPSNYRPYQPEQSFLLPPSPRDWLPENHLALFISDVVDELDRSAFAGRDEESDPRGIQTFHRAMMLKILVYACDRNVLVAKDRQEDRRGRSVSSAVGRELSAASNDLRFPEGVSERVHRTVRAGGSDCEGQRADQTGTDRDRWNQDQSECEPAQSDELRPDETGREAAGKEIADLLKQAERADRSELAMGDWVTASPLVERQSPQ